MQVIARAGHWLPDAMHKSYLKFYKPEQLLASGEWPIDKPHALFWAPRFMMQVPERLIDLIFPFLRPLQQKVASMGSAARPSHQAVPKVLHYLAIALIQDALELAERFPDDPAHKLLLNDTDFMYGPPPLGRPCQCRAGC